MSLPSVFFLSPSPVALNEIDFFFFFLFAQLVCLICFYLMDTIADVMNLVGRLTLRLRGFVSNFSEN
jgi:hypothetical protein